MHAAGDRFAFCLQPVNGVRFPVLNSKLHPELSNKLHSSVSDVIIFFSNGVEAKVSPDCCIYLFHYTTMFFSLCHYNSEDNKTLVQHLCFCNFEFLK